MARYIDADKLKMDSDINNFDMPYGCSFRVIDRQPTADVVEIPCRCRGCKHRRETMHGSYCLPAYGLKQITDLDAFCSYGERRTDNDL